MRILFLVSLLAVSQLGFGAKPNAKDVTTKNTEILLEIVIGERVSWFKVDKAPKPGKSQFTIEFRNNKGDLETSDVSKENFEYLKKTVAELKEPSHDFSFCERNHIKVITKKGVKFACENSETSLGVKSRNLVKLMKYLF